VTKWRRRDAWAVAALLRAPLSTLLRSCVEALRAARPDIPRGLTDRAEDVLEPLLAIADLAGDSWPARARSSAIALMGDAAREGQEADQTIGLALLQDCHDVFASEGFPDRIPTRSDTSAVPPTVGLLDALVAMEDRPWATFTKGKPLTSHKLARLLRPFEVFPAGKMRGDCRAKPFRGYRLAVFGDAFARYLRSKVEPGNRVNNDAV
jgi:hypothetical protein